MAKSYALHRVRDTRLYGSKKMPQPASAYDVHQRERWLRHDAHLWIRPDFARWLKPGTDPAEVFPELKRQREAAEDAAFAAQIAASQRVLTMLRAEVDELKAALARRRLEEAKYSPSQPRVPKRNPGGGRFTRIGGGIGQSPPANIAQPMGNVDVGDLTGSSDAGGLFDIAPDDTSFDGVDLAADFNQVGSDGKPVIDVDGSPYYAPKGHHEMPKGVYSKWDLSPETEKVFNQSTTGELPKGRVPVNDEGMLIGHYWDGPNGNHRVYNDAVAELSDKFMKERDITSERMTPDQARDLLKEIRESDDPRIRDYNRTIRMLRRVFRLRGGRE
jgi:hypothetical protein